MKEELEKEADNYAEKHAFRVPYDGSNKFYDDVDFKASKEGYLAGAKSREKQIEVLTEENKAAKEIINEYYDLMQSMLIHHKNDTEKSVKLELKVEQFLKEAENGKL